MVCETKNDAFIPRLCYLEEACVYCQNLSITNLLASSKLKARPHICCRESSVPHLLTNAAPALAVPSPCRSNCLHCYCGPAAIQTPSKSTLCREQLLVRQPDLRVVAEGKDNSVETWFDSVWVTFYCYVTIETLLVSRTNVP